MIHPQFNCIVVMLYLSNSVHLINSRVSKSKHTAHRIRPQLASCSCWTLLHWLDNARSCKSVAWPERVNGNVLGCSRPLLAEYTIQASLQYRAKLTEEEDASVFRQNCSTCRRAYIHSLGYNFFVNEHFIKFRPSFGLIWLDIFLCEKTLQCWIIKIIFNWGYTCRRQVHLL